MVKVQDTLQMNNPRLGLIDIQINNFRGSLSRGCTCNVHVSQSGSVVPTNLLDSIFWDIVLANVRAWVGEQTNTLENHLDAYWLCDGKAVEITFKH
jgi:hypothetical protein